MIERILTTFVAVMIVLAVISIGEELTNTKKEPIYCVHHHIGNSIIEYCSKNVECQYGEDSTGSMKICRIIEAKEVGK